MIGFLLVLLVEFLPLALVPVLSRMPASILERMTWFHVATLSSRLLHLPCVARKWLSLFFSRLSPALVYGVESPNTNKLTLFLEKGAKTRIGKTWYRIRAFVPAIISKRVREPLLPFSKGIQALRGV
jgi:hypothetical protein